MTKTPQIPRHGQQANHAGEQGARSIYPEPCDQTASCRKRFLARTRSCPRPTIDVNQICLRVRRLPAFDATARRYLCADAYQCVERAPPTIAFTTATSASVYVNKQHLPPPGPYRPLLQWELPNKKSTSASGGSRHAGGLRGKYTPPARLTHASGSGLYPGGRLGRGGLKVKAGGTEKNGNVQGGEGGGGGGCGWSRTRGDAGELGRQEGYNSKSPVSGPREYKNQLKYENTTVGWGGW